MTEKKNLRRLALALLSEYEASGKYINLALNSHKADSLTKEERSSLTALLYTTVEHKLTYDYYICALSKRSIDKIDPTTRNILRIGLCQLLDMDGVPEFAAVNEAVNLTRNKGERAFVNGILREAQRQKGNLPMPERAKNPARYLSVYYSFPHHTVKRLISVFGEEGAEDYLRAVSKPAPTDVSVNTTKISVADYAKKLADMGFECEVSSLSPITVRILGSVDPRALPGYSEGEFFVQDTACSAAISLLSLSGGERVIDVCSAPGGKSFAAAVMMGDRGRVSSFDIHESKLSLIESGAQRLGLSSVSPSVRDATSPDESLLGTADAVICDVPCSGLGVLSKKSDLRYKDESAFSALPELQYEILSASAKYLRRGGRMIYSTCTVLPEENERVIEKFLLENPGFKRVPFDIAGERCESGIFTFLPHIHNTDGFFVSLLEKESL